MALLAVTVAALFALLSLRAEFLLLPLPTASNWALALGALAYLTVVVAAPTRVWSAGAVFLLLVLLFHLGLLLVTASGLAFDPALAGYMEGWFSGSGVIEAVYVSSVAVNSFAVVYAVFVRPGRVVAPEALEESPQESPEESKAYGITFATIGAGLVLGGASAYLLYLSVNAPDLLFSAGQYQEYIDSFGGDRTLSLLNLGIMIGIVLVAAAPACTPRRIAFGGFVVFAVVLLILGLRTAVLFPLAAAMVASARAHGPPRPSRALAALVLGLVFISGARHVRTAEDLADVSASNLNPLTAIAEMGGSLRPLAETIDARTPPLDGRTYLIPVTRLADRLLGRPPAPRDASDPEVLMATRVPGYQIGYSAVAEAFYNFGTRGVVVIFGLIGLLLARLDGWRKRGIVPACLLGLAIAGLGLTVRNTFVSLPSTVIAGSVVIALAHLWAGSTARRTERASSRS